MDMLRRMDEYNNTRPTPRYDRVVETVQECEAMCEETMTAIKRYKDMRMRMRQMGLLHDCADICGLTAKYMARRSTFSRRMAAQCAEVCTDCGNECMRFSDAESQECGEMCLRCARECRDYAAVRQSY